MTVLGLQIALVFAWSGVVDAGEAQTREHRYLRVTTKGKSNECKFVVTQHDDSWLIRAVTGALKVSAAYDRKDQLTAAIVAQSTGGKKTIALVTVTAGRAEITSGGKTTELEVPPSVIVTSAPDWSDVFLMCRRYDRAKGGKQSFPGLWLHPDKGAFRLTFTIERVGKDTIELGEKKRMADRFIIHLRNKSEYTAWADDDGLLLRLRPGSKGTPAYELLLDKASRERKRPE